MLLDGSNTISFPSVQLIFQNFVANPKLFSFRIIRASLERLRTGPRRTNRGGMPPSSYLLRPLVLASASPRRRDLLTEAGYDFVIQAANVDEVHDEAASLHALTMENAAAKARHIAHTAPDRLVVAADTLVCIAGRALTKPADMDEARAMIDSLAGRTHFNGFYSDQVVQFSDPQASPPCS